MSINLKYFKHINKKVMYQFSNAVQFTAFSSNFDLIILCFVLLGKSDHCAPPPCDVTCSKKSKKCHVTLWLSLFPMCHFRDTLSSWMSSSIWMAPNKKLFILPHLKTVKISRKNLQAIKLGFKLMFNPKPSNCFRIFQISYFNGTISQILPFLWPFYTPVFPCL